MKYNAITLFLIFSLLSCSSGQKNISERQWAKNRKEGFIKFFKVQAYCSCLDHSYENKEIEKLVWKEDLGGIYDDLANDMIQKTIDSLGQQIALTIKPETHMDFENKKFITVACLDFYTSKKLDSIAKAEAEKYLSNE